MSEQDGREWIEALKSFYEKSNITGSMQYGGQFYVTCEEFGLDPEEVKKEVESRD